MNREHSDTFSALKGLLVKGRGDELVTRAWGHIWLRALLEVGTGEAIW